MKNYKKILKISVALILVALSYLGYYIYKWEFQIEDLRVNFFSLNRGRAIFITTPHKKHILIGGGQNSLTIREITRSMPFYRRTIDLLIIPSAYPAEIGGLIEIIDRYKVEEVMMPRIMSTSTVLTLLLKEIRKQNIHIKEVERGDGVELEGDLSLEVLFPYKDFKYNKTSLPELGLGIVYGKTEVYLMGNLSKTIQKDIAKNMATSTTENLVEFYNSGNEKIISPDLLHKINPKFIFSKNEKSQDWLSDGEVWIGY